MNLRFIASARDELNSAFDWYENQVPGLGFEFLNELDRVIHRIKLFPESCPTIIENLRRAQLNRFPLGVICGTDIDSLVIVAVAHLHRRPLYWIDRV
jgi:hypothetical protein